MVDNLRHWLAPTVLRLEKGLILRSSNDFSQETKNNKLIEQVISAFKENIDDENGHSLDEKSHANLFLKSSRRYADIIYGKELECVETLNETQELKKVSYELFSHDVYTMLGACFAQEIHALPQLEFISHGLSINKHNLDLMAWEDVSYFYKIHLDGTEARHADDL